MSLQTRPQIIIVPQFCVSILQMFILLMRFWLLRSCISTQTKVPFLFVCRQNYWWNDFVLWMSIPKSRLHLPRWGRFYHLTFRRSNNLLLCVIGCHCRSPSPFSQTCGLSHWGSDKFSHFRLDTFSLILLCWSNKQFWWIWLNEFFWPNDKTELYTHVTSFWTTTICEKGYKLSCLLSLLDRVIWNMPKFFAATFPLIKCSCCLHSLAGITWN